MSIFGLESASAPGGLRKHGIGQPWPELGAKMRKRDRSISSCILRRSPAASCSSRSSSAAAAIAAVLLVLGVALLGCAGTAPPIVGIQKTAPTIINTKPVVWDGSNDATAAAGFDQQWLCENLRAAGLDCSRLTVRIDSDERKCGPGASSVRLSGVFSYDGRQGNFIIEQDRKYHLGFSRADINRRCNLTAATALAVGVYRSIHSQ